MDPETLTLAVTEAELAPPAAPQPAAPQPASPEIENRLLRWFELGLVLLIAFGSFFLSSFSYYAGARPMPADWSQNMRWTTALFQESIALLLLGYVLARRKLRIRDLGLRWSFRELGPGALLAIASYLAYALGYAVLNAVHRKLFGAVAHTTPLHTLFGYASVMMLVFSVVNPFFEELIVRAYLMTEIKALTGSWALAALLSTAVQTSYHLYYGWTLALALGFQFLVFSVYYARTRRATPLVLSHGIFDLLGVLQLL
jgi:membrane protease YdiL (CAAX protease family)